MGGWQATFASNFALKMEKNRLEAFSDGVLAIILTIMVLELKIPRGDTSWSALEPLFPVFGSYLMSFLLVGIFWGNHHHLLHGVKKASSGIILSNLNMLFWLSLTPFVTGWMGENHFAPNTIVLYAIVFLLSGLAYGILQHLILKQHTIPTALMLAIKKQRRKNVISFLCQSTAIPAAYVHSAISITLIAISALIWLVPDKNIERALEKD